MRTDSLGNYEQKVFEKGYHDFMKGVFNVTKVKGFLGKKEYQRGWDKAYLDNCVKISKEEKE